MAVKQNIYKDGKTPDEYFLPGFLMPSHSLYEDKHICRSRWYIPYYFKDVIPDTPIPRISWMEAANSPQRKLAAKLLNDCAMYMGSLEKFLSFVLFGYNKNNEDLWKTAQFEEIRRWETNITQALPLMLEAPWPYFTDFIETNSSKSAKDAHGFFATPMNISVMMAEMQLCDNKDIAASVYDPCVGTGNLLLAASNYSINLYGQDIGHTVLMGCMIHMHMYVPWAIAPLKCLVSQPTIGQANSLVNQKICPHSKTEQEIVSKKSKKKKIS